MKPKLLLPILVAAILLEIYACNKSKAPTTAANNASSSNGNNNNNNGNNNGSKLPCIPSSLTSGVIAFYPFTGGSLNDFSGSGMHLTNSTTASSAKDRSGNSNCAFQFENYGKTEYLVSNSVGAFSGLTAMTVAFWYMATDTNHGMNGQKAQYLVTQDSTTGSTGHTGQWYAGLTDCRRAIFGHWGKFHALDLWLGVQSCDSNIDARVGKWRHYASTYDHATSTTKLYIDGVLQDTETGSIAGFGTNASGSLRVGTDYSGMIDDIVIYNKYSRIVKL